MSNIRNSWQETTIGEVADISSGFGFPKDRQGRKIGDYPFAKVSDISRAVAESGGKLSSAANFVDVADLRTLRAQPVSAGSTVFAKIGEALHLNRRAITEVDVVLDNNCMALTPTAGRVLPRYLFLFMQTVNLSPFAVATAVPSVRRGDVASLSIPIPDLAEQHEVVAKLDSLIDRVARAREQLGRIPKLIQKYRETILAAAFNGELTKEWRRSNGFQTPKLTTLGTLVSDVSYGTAKKCHAGGNGVPVLRIPNVSAGKIDLSDLKYADFEQKELAKLRLHEGDVLIVRSNGSAELVGKPALVEDSAIGLAYAGYLIRLRPKKGAAQPRFLRAMLQAPQVRKIIETNARSTSGVHNINSKELAALEIPQPTIHEQDEIVRHIETAFTWLDRVATEHANASRLLPKLDQAILTKAFRGELVPQDPNDKPIKIGAKSPA